MKIIIRHLETEKIQEALTAAAQNAKVETFIREKAIASLRLSGQDAVLDVTTFDMHIGKGTASQVINQLRRAKIAELKQNAIPGQASPALDELEALLQEPAPAPRNVLCPGLFNRPLDPSLAITDAPSLAGPIRFSRTCG